MQLLLLAISKWTQWIFFTAPLIFIASTLFPFQILPTLQIMSQDSLPPKTFSNIYSLSHTCSYQSLIILHLIGIRSCYTCYSIPSAPSEAIHFFFKIIYTISGHARRCCKAEAVEHHGTMRLLKAALLWREK